MASFRDPFPILEVADIRRSLAFYADLLGFQTTYGFPSPDDPQFVALELGGRELGLSVADGRVETASTSIWLYTDDVDGALNDLRAADVPVLAEPADQPWGERLASVSDPDGYTIHIGAPRAE
jgi:lactoylglutathione lyase